MDNKTLSIVSYITLIGWLVAYFVGKDKADDLLKYHLKQSLGLMLASILVNIVFTVLVRILPASIVSIIGILSMVISLGFLALLIMGIINAAKSEKKPMPVIGKFFEDKFDFIK